ncbi:MAG: glycosyltransferase [Nanoarchaeota archaeon]
MGPDGEGTMVEMTDARKDAPRVLVGCPTYAGKEYCWQQYRDGLKAIAYPNKGILIVDNSKEDIFFEKMRTDVPVIKDVFQENPKDRIVQSRNILRRKVLDEGYEYFLSLEQDVVPPPDIIERLLAHGKEIVGAVVATIKVSPSGKNVVVPMLWHMRDDRIFFIPSQELMSKRLISIDVCSLSCLLIHRTVLQKVEFRYEQGFDDMMFCRDAKEHGFDIFVDTAVQVKHYGRPMPNKA